jgi:hypothetical protein
VTTPVPDADAAEQRRTLDGSDADSVDLPIAAADAAEADVLEQARAVTPAATTPPAGDLPLEADAADATDQGRVEPLDEDEGRE